MKYFTRWARCLAAGVGMLVLGTSVAQAGFTSVNSPWPGELTVPAILKAAYGDGVIATRIDDSADQNWSGNVLSTRALARYAKYSQGLAFDSGSGAVSQFDVVGSGLAVTGNGGAFSADNFSIIRTGFNGNQSSVDSVNPTGRDHMITYLIDSPEAGVKTYALFFENWAGAGTDWDFNDLVVEMKVAAMPLPAPVLMGLMGLGLAAAAKRFRRRPE